MTAEKILATVRFVDVHKFRITDDRGRKDTVGVGSLRRHQTIGGKEESGGNSVEFLLLILPGSAEIPLEPADAS